MDKIRVTPTTWRRLQQNADEYAAEIAAITTPEQIESVRRQNDLFDRALEICSNCNRESMRNRKLASFAVRINFRFNLKAQG
jgi:hypothetical protein